MASPVECELLFGYAPGAIPPLAHRSPHTRMVLEAGLVRDGGEEGGEGEVCACVGSLFSCVCMVIYMWVDVYSVWSLFFGCGVWLYMGVGDPNTVYVYEDLSP